MYLTHGVLKKARGNLEVSLERIYIYMLQFLNVELTFLSAVVTSSLLFLLILFVKLR